MHQHQIGAVERGIQIEPIRVVVMTGQLGIMPAKSVERGLAALLDQIAPAPAVARLVNAHVVAAPEQFARDPAQEMRVTVIPIGNQRVIEENDSHGAACARAAARLLASR
ncbi:MAG TPA: hypothetical protein VFJ08_04775 [Salinisphaera sp.]|nr:hypothetical protein [Salinisphaera sp.]HET7313648.1 hypothetical protein [Salinisphaera sp.]